MSKKFVCLLACTMLLLVACSASNRLAPVTNAPIEGGQSNSHGDTPQLLVDKDYLSALNTANHFLNAWLLRDWQGGPQYLTTDLKIRLGSDAVKRFFSGVSNPYHQRFEIAGLDRPTRERIRFNVWLYEDYTNGTPAPQQLSKSLILSLVQTRENEWLIGALL